VKRGAFLLPGTRLSTSEHAVAARRLYCSNITKKSTSQNFFAGFSLFPQNLEINLEMKNFLLIFVLTKTNET
jgi:hypothetical protein